MREQIALFLVCLSITNGNPAAGKPWHWKPRMPVLSPDDFFKPFDRIIGETEATSHSWSHQVALFIDDMYFCGGSLISNEWVLTAAHCMEGSMYVDVVMGVYNIGGNEDTQLTVRSDVYFVHEHWNSFTLANDIAVIKLSEPVDFNENINSVGLPSVDVSVGDTLIATSWGKLSSNGELLTAITEVNVTVISNTECAVVYGPMIDERILCGETIGGQGICPGNSGSLHKDGKIHGIGSFGSAAGCELGYPDGFTRVIQFLEWIENRTGVTPQ